MRDKFQRNMSPQKFTFFDWTTRPHSYFASNDSEDAFQELTNWMIHVLNNNASN